MQATDKNNRRFQGPLMGLGFLLVIFTLVAIPLANPQFSFSVLNSIYFAKEKQYLSCKKVDWLEFLELRLLDCKSSGNDLAFQSISFNLLNGKLNIKGLKYKIVPKPLAKKEFPKLPRFIREINLDGAEIFYLAKSFPISKVVVEKLSMKRLNGILADNWRMETSIAPHSSIKIAGIIGDHLDIRADLTKAQYSFFNRVVELNGSFKAKSQKLFDKSIWISLKNLQIRTIDPQPASALDLNGDLEINSDMNKLLSFSKMYVKFDTLVLRSNPKDPQELLIEKESVINLFHNLSKFVKITKFIPKGGSLHGKLKVNTDKPLESKIILTIQDLAGSIKNGKNLLSFNRTDIEFDGLPLKALLAERSKNNNFFLPSLNPNLKRFFKDFGIYNLQILFKDSLLKAENLELILKGNLTINHKEGLNGDISVKKAQMNCNNQGVGFCNGSGFLLIKEDLAKIKLILSNINHTNSLKKEKVNIDAVMYLKNNLPLQIDVKAPSISMAESSLTKSSLAATLDIKNFQLSAELRNLKDLVLKRFNGQISNLGLKDKNNGKELKFAEGKFSFNGQRVQLQGLKLFTPDGYADLSGSLPIKINLNKPSLEKLNLEFNSKLSMNDLDGFSSFFTGKKLQEFLCINSKDKQCLNYTLKGLFETHLKIINGKIQSLKFNGESLNVNLNGENLIQEGKLICYLGEKSESLNAEMTGFFLEKNRFNLKAFIKNPYGAYNSGHGMPLAKLFNITGPTINLKLLVNPDSIVKFMRRNDLFKGTTIEFNDQVIVPLMLKLKLKDKNLWEAKITSNFRKLILYKNVINLSQDNSSIESINGLLDFNTSDNHFNLRELYYTGKDFGIKFVAEGTPKKFDLLIESAPLLDLGEIAKIWSNEYAKGRFRGRLFIKDFQPEDQLSMLRNMETQLYSEDDADDFQYGIIYGKYFELNGQTKDGNGLINLSTDKGKIKNLQITGLNSTFEIKDGKQAVLKECTLTTANGQGTIMGRIDVPTGETFLFGSMRDVNIETISNNLFGNLGDYNGKGSLSYELFGNFADILQSQPPQMAFGEFKLNDGYVRQVVDLSKNLNLANLIFGMPLSISFSTIDKIINPQSDGEFIGIAGRWSFTNKNKKIFLTDTKYVGTNALHLSLNGEWDFKIKQLYFDVYGFIPKRPLKLSERDLYVEKDPTKIDAPLIKEAELIRIAKKSRHFRFKIFGDILKPDSLKDSVKSTIDFTNNWSVKDLQKRFMNEI
jgi:hypothetical protein